MRTLRDLLAKELAEQGHRNTGALERSLSYEVKRESDKVVGLMTANMYAIFLEFGVPASRIPYTPGSGAKRSKYIQGLITYFTTKGLNPNEAKSAAFATARAHKREGMPTRASSRFSSSGRRTGFIRHTLSGQLPTLVDELKRAAAGEVYITLAGQPFSLDYKII